MKTLLISNISETMMENLISDELYVTVAEAERFAFDFLMQDLEIPLEAQEWFTAISSRQVGDGWYIVEIGVEGIPDRWVIQVYDTGECDPNYTFVSPMRASDGGFDLEELPDAIARAVLAERGA